MVIPDCPWGITESFLDYYGIDYIYYGGDPRYVDPMSVYYDYYKPAIDRNSFILLEYSPDNSTSKIIENIKKY